MNLVYLTVRSAERRCLSVGQTQPDSLLDLQVDSIEMARQSRSRQMATAVRDLTTTTAMAFGSIRLFRLWVISCSICFQIRFLFSPEL